MNIAFITNKPYESSETFVKAQIDNLPFHIRHYWGRKLPFNLKVAKTTLFSIGLQKFGLKYSKSDVNIFANDLICNKIDLVFAQYGMMGEEVLEACKVLDLPLVVHFHGHDAVRKSILERYNNYANLFSYEKLTIISVSHEMTKRLIKIGCPQDKIIYNVYGPNNEFLKLEPKFSKKQFISIGRFVEKKAPHLTILAFNEVLKTHLDVTLIFAGDGVLLDSCINLVQALGIEKHVEFPGRITPSQFQDYLCESMGYVQHSIEAQDGDMEGTPVSILEASATGIPIVSTYHAGIPDIIVHNETGLLSAERNIQDMAQHLLWLVENKHEAIKMGKNGKEAIRDKYSMTHHIENLTNIIKEASKTS